MKDIILLAKGLVMNLLKQRNFILCYDQMVAPKAYFPSSVTHHTKKKSFALLLLILESVDIINVVHSLRK